VEQEDARQLPQEDPEDAFPSPAEVEPEAKPNREGSLAASVDPQSGQRGFFSPLIRVSKTRPQAPHRKSKIGMAS
jgi:hypothetical protein